MPAYAIAHLRTVEVGPDIVEYLDRIDATLEPFGGRFIIHGATPEVREDAFPGTIVVIEFPDRAAATRVVRVPGLPGDPAAADRELRRDGVPHRRREARPPRARRDRRLVVARRGHDRARGPPSVCSVRSPPRSSSSSRPPPGPSFAVTIAIVIATIAMPTSSEPTSCLAPALTTGTPRPSSPRSRPAA